MCRDVSRSRDYAALTSADLYCFDVAINQMYKRLDHKAIPSGASMKASDGSHYVPQSTEMMVTAGSEGSSPALSY
jgi:hypothetical protein